MKVSELSGARLDLWVAKAEGLRIVTEPPSGEERKGTAWLTGAIWEGDTVAVSFQKVIRWGLGMFGVFAPSTCWADGGPIIQRQRMAFWIADDQSYIATVQTASGHIFHWDGETHLIAAMRTYVASKFGEEVPDEVLA
jgi:hypothetical protein